MIRVALELFFKLQQLRDSGKLVKEMPKSEAVSVLSMTYLNQIKNQKTFQRVHKEISNSRIETLVRQILLF